MPLVAWRPPDIPFYHVFTLFFSTVASTFVSPPIFRSLTINITVRGLLSTPSVNGSYSLINRFFLYYQVCDDKLHTVAMCSVAAKIQVFMVTKSCTKILILPNIFPTKFYFTFHGDKILYKNLPRFSHGLLAKPTQDFQMAAVTKILMRRDKSIAPLLFLGG